ncbi:Serine-protein kinase ATM [Armadillidium nasatum]|uniref:non-specific serine/threonine protein kinase n=1 Tax=Armadillidium nasatum TaxID=96803 RepID=A0A5N5TH08_9CRUS|nr:Serine-protein kinase ATM [Armadillidium nasatum]
MFHTLFKITQNSSESNLYSAEAKAECAWRLGLWEDCDEVKNGMGFNQYYLHSLKSLKGKDFLKFDETKKLYFEQVVEFVKESGIESASSIYPVLGNLQIFSELSEIFKIFSTKSEEEMDSFTASLNSSWIEKENFGSVEKEMKELILSARISALQILSQSFKNSNGALQNLIFRLLLKKCEIGNLRERFHSLLEAKKIEVSMEENWELRLQDVKLALSLDRISQAVCTLGDILQDIKGSNLMSNKKRENHYETLVLYGMVLTQSRTQSPQLVIENYFQEAINLIENSSGRTDDAYLEDCYHNLASFGDNLYQEVKESSSSEHSQNRIKHIEQSEQEMRQLRELISTSKPKQGLSIREESEHKHLLKRYKILERDIAREENEIKVQEKEEEYYLHLSLENYLKVLCCSSKYDLNIFRVVALWLENLKSDTTNILVSKYCPKIKSHKFIPLLYQLVARLQPGCSQTISDSDNQHRDFSVVLSSILERVCLNHPHHGLPVVLMLANAHLDEELNQSTQTKRKSGQRQLISDEDRVKAAKSLVSNMKKTKLLGHIEELEKVFLAYITLANRDKKKTFIKMTSDDLLMKLNQLQYTAPLTRKVRIEQSAVYSVPIISNWGSSVEHVGGINQPLKLSLLSSDGIWSHELLKGNDDLRQDAVLEQVFNVMNELLRKDKEAVKQKLCVKTYLVVPLSQKTGVIQWCDNTAEILDKHHPVFRYFFYEQYPNPEKWFTHRRSYTCSVATTSIAGYILGLGDRHVQNLLIDINSAEIIHIDLGIAFENGKLLPTPERVPFRLTQNIIDGFGVMGVEGPLRKSMETTLKVLREAKSVLITIVEVLRHDPLHHWALTPIQIAKLQRQQSLSQEFNFTTESCSSSSMAERALLRVQQKLNGLENGLVVSVSEHVSILIQQAMDIKNIACMYYGWQPYL